MKLKGSILFLIIVIFFKTFLFELYFIPSLSMYPNLLPGDIVLVKKFNIRPKEGSVIVFKSPIDRVSFIKRVIATENHMIQTKPEGVYINNFLTPHIGVAGINKDWLLFTNGHSFFLEKNSYIVAKIKPSYSPSGRVEIAHNCFFVMGDNRDESLDSRNFGQICHESIKGEALIILFNLNIPRYSDFKHWFSLKRFFIVL